MIFQLRVRIPEKLATLPMGYFNERTSGKIKKVMREDVEQMEVFIGHNMPDYLGVFAYLIMITTILFVFDWRLAMATICVLRRQCAWPRTNL